MPGAPPLRASLDEMLCRPATNGSGPPGAPASVTARRVAAAAAAAAAESEAAAVSVAAAPVAVAGPASVATHLGDGAGSNGHGATRSLAAGPHTRHVGGGPGGPIPSSPPRPARIAGSTTTPTRGRQWVSNPGVSVETVRTTVALRDELVRCYAVARGYERLSRELADRLGSGDANWATWAMWATYSVSSTLDEQQTPLALSMLFDRLHAPQWLRGRLHQVYLWTSVHVNEQQRIGLSLGNTDVYSQIGCDLARFLDLYEEPDGQPDDARLAEFLRSVQAPPERPDLAERLDALHEGFRCYQRAAAATEPRARSEQVLAGNLYIATYEQVQLQPYLDRVLFLAPVAPLSVRNLVRRLTGPCVARLMTRFLVNVSLPDEVVWAARGVPPRRGESTVFPPALAELSSPLARGAFAMWDRPGSTSVTNWADLADRMNFAVNILRSRQQDPTMFDSPFTPDVAAALDRVLERGRLTPAAVRTIEVEARGLPRRAAREGRAVTPAGRPLQGGR
jgi:hypothetical protein